MNCSQRLLLVFSILLACAGWACSNDDDDDCRVTDPNSDCFICKPDENGNCNPCDPTDPTSECYVCDASDPDSECYECDPTDPNSECYLCDPTDPESDCYECNPDNAFGECYECDPFDPHARCFIEGFNAEFACVAPQQIRSGVGLANDVLEAATEVILTHNRELAVEDTAWDWGPSIVNYAGMKLHAQHPNPDLYDYAKSYIDYHIERGHNLKMSDHTPGGATAAILWEETGEEVYQTEVDNIVEYLYETVPRLDTGAITHWGTMPIISGPIIYVDSLWMFGLFNFQAFETYGDLKHLDLESQQILLFSDYLLDSDHDLWYHGYSEERPGDELRPSQPYFWARGNAWVFGAMSLWLSLAPAEHPDRDAMLDIYRKQAAAIASLQRCDGLWDTIMNSPQPDNTYPETSSSALFSFGFSTGVRLGLLDAKYAANAELALEGLLEKTVADDEGTYLLMTSEGTNSTEYEAYNTIYVSSNVPWGVGTYVLAALAYEALTATP